MRRTLVRLAVGSAVLAPSAPARAAPAQGFHEGGFVYGAVPSVSIPVGDPGFVDITAPGLSWGVGGGYMFAPTRHFMATLGGSFEHAWLNFEPDGVGGNIVRFLPEVRVGGGTPRLFGYGVAQPGFAVAIFEWEVAGNRFDDAEPGFTMGVGGGFQGTVWRNLMVGAEIGVDLGFFGDDEDATVGDDTAEIYTLEVKLMVGWYF